jgi:hypothetical protein
MYDKTGFKLSTNTWLASNRGGEKSHLHGGDGKFTGQKIARTIEYIEVKASISLAQMRLNAIHDAGIANQGLR